MNAVIAPRFFQKEGHRLIDNGYLVTPIKPGKKRPILDDWPTLVFSVSDLARYPNAGVGIICGRGPRPVYAIDFDILNAGIVERCAQWCRDTFGWTIERVGQEPKLLMVYRGSTAETCKITGPWLEDKRGIKHRIEALGFGQQFVAHGVHPDTGLEYHWVDLIGGAIDNHVDSLPVVTPEQLAEAVGACTALALEHGLALSPGAEIVQLARSGAFVSDPLMRDDEPVADLTLERAAEILGMLSSDDRSAWISAGMALHHQFAGSDEACAAWDEWSALSEKYPGPEDVQQRWAGFGDRGGRRPLTFRWVLKQAGAAVGGPVAAKAAEVAASTAAVEMSQWRPGMMSAAKGGFLANLHNARHLLLNHDELGGRVRFNTVARRKVLMQSVPWKQIEQTGFHGVPWTDYDTHALRLWMEAVLGKPIADRDVNAAVTITAHQAAYDPLIDMLNGMPEWDGVERLDSALVRHLGAEDTPYVRAVTRKTFVAAVARAMRPGTKFDYVLMLQGAEGMRKSMFCSIIAMHPELFGENPPPFGASGDAFKEFLRGKWIVELSELASLGKSELEHIKSTISSQTDTYRAKYERETDDNLRRCILIGTTNSKKPLRDPTGNRRWWVVKISKRADDVELRAEVHQLWAEAVMRYRAGEAVWLDDPVLEAAAKDRQEDARDVAGDIEAMAGLIELWLSRPLPSDYYDNALAAVDNLGGKEPIARDRVCAAEIWKECLNERGSMSQVNSRRIGEAMALLEDQWTQIGATDMGRFGRQRAWRKRLRL